MAWVATDNFDSYTLDADLNGGAGGSGWTGNWAKAGVNTMLIKVAPAGGQGGNAVYAAAGGRQYTRTFTAVSTGILSIAIYTTSTTHNDYLGFILKSGTGSPIYLDLSSYGAGSGQIYVYNGATNVDSGLTYSASIWCVLRLELDGVNHPNKCRLSVDGVNWSDWLTCNGSFTSIDSIKLDCSSSTGVYFDDIQNGEGLANLKTYNTNAKANIKTINTNPIANVKSLNTNV